MSIIEWIIKKLSGNDTPTSEATTEATTGEQMIHRNIQAIGLHYFPDDELSLIHI